jgi:hypothetical protein
MMADHSATSQKDVSFLRSFQDVELSVSDILPTTWRGTLSSCSRMNYVCCQVRVPRTQVVIVVDSNDMSAKSDVTWLRRDSCDPAVSSHSDSKVPDGRTSEEVTPVP